MVTLVHARAPRSYGPCHERLHCYRLRERRVSRGLREIADFKALATEVAFDQIRRRDGPISRRPDGYDGADLQPHRVGADRNAAQLFRLLLAVAAPFRRLEAAGAQHGRVAEWFKAPVLKSGSRHTGSQLLIPLWPDTSRKFRLRVSLSTIPFQPVPRSWVVNAVVRVSVQWRPPYRATR
jgi:hypothetical protein